MTKKSPDRLMRDDATKTLEMAQNLITQEKQARAETCIRAVDALLQQYNCRIVLLPNPIGDNTFQFGISIAANDPKAEAAPVPPA